MANPLDDVFAEPERTRNGALGWVEPSVHWFTEITRPEATASRRNVNEWYRAFPHDPTFLARLRSESNVDHIGALDELFVHHLLRPHFDAITYEEGGRGPDFRLYRSGQLVAAVEVASLFMREDWNEEERRFGRLADELNRRVPLTRYFVRIEPEVLLREPSMKRLASVVHKTIEGLPDPATVAELANRQEHPRSALPSVVYSEGDDVRLKLEFFPRRADTEPHPDDRIVGMGPMTGGLVNSGDRLKGVLTAKRGSRYDLGAVPYVVAVGVHDSFCSIDQIEQALYGTERITIPSGRATRAGDGFFGVDLKRRSGRNTRVSAVWVLDGFHSWCPEGVRLLRLDNPYAANPLSSDTLPVTSRFGVQGTDGTTMRMGWTPERPDRTHAVEDEAS